MATLDHVRAIAKKLTGTEVSEGERFGLSVPVKGKLKGYVWAWMERADPKKPKVANNAVLAIVVPNLTAKELVIAASPEKFVDDPHYNGFPAVLARIEAFEPEELEDLILEAWKARAPKKQRRELE
ncbi:MAG: hypothetical protein HZC36_09395 [Armatimonadetes bacterium]|nr:hypothetical protein [Armatimonadota bacterium]